MFPEALGKNEATIAEEVQNVSKENAVAVKENATAGVAGMVRVAEGGRGERVGFAEDRVARGGVVHAAHVEFQDFSRRVRHGWGLGAQ